jgi:hypothetical protein
VKESGLSRKRVKAAGLKADELERAIVNALSAGNGRPCRVQDEGELIGYLAADGVVDRSCQPKMVGPAFVGVIRIRQRRCLIMAVR